MLIKKTNENSDPESKIEIVKASKFPDGKVGVRYSFKTSFGEERTDFVTGTKNYVEKKLRDKGFRGFIDYNYKPPTT